MTTEKKTHTHRCVCCWRFILSNLYIYIEFVIHYVKMRYVKQQQQQPQLTTVRMREWDRDVTTISVKQKWQDIFKKMRLHTVCMWMSRFMYTSLSHLDNVLIFKAFFSLQCEQFIQLTRWLNQMQCDAKQYHNFNASLNTYTQTHEICERIRGSKRSKKKNWYTSCILNVGLKWNCVSLQSTHFLHLLHFFSSLSVFSCLCTQTQFSNPKQYQMKNFLSKLL